MTRLAWARRGERCHGLAPSCWTRSTGPEEVLARQAKRAAEAERGFLEEMPPRAEPELLLLEVIGRLTDLHDALSSGFRRG